jgi:hypothetical protein
MQSKSTRGVQQDDVWGAADALIAEGLRPTIERVRQKMGRGSPNTVSPMLDSWFGALGARLVGSKTTADVDAIPHCVQQGMEKLWEMALANGREEALLQAAQIQATLEDERAKLASQAIDLAYREQQLAERLYINEASLEAARTQIEDLKGHAALLQQSLKDRQMEVAQLRAKIDLMEQAREAERRKAADDFAHQVTERRRADERATANDRRLLEEVDRARQESKLARASAMEFEKRMAAQQSRWDELLRARNSELSLIISQGEVQTTEITALRDALATAHSRAEELKGMLDRQHQASEAVIAQLSQALTNQSRSQKLTDDSRKRKTRGNAVKRRFKSLE